MSLPGLDYGGRRPTMNAGRKRQDGDYGNSPQAAALRRQLAGLAKLEQTPVYQEMCAAATRSVADGTYHTRKWGDYNAATSRKAVSE